MSANLIIAVWTHYPEGGATLQALQAIAEAANEQGNCCLRIELLAAAARLSRRTMQRAVERLREERWIVTSRMLGQGARLVYQLNLPLLRRADRRNHDEPVMHAQRVRTPGPTEAGLVERVSLRGPVSPEECQDDAASVSSATMTPEQERQVVLCQDGAANGLERPLSALEESLLARQEISEGDLARVAELQDHFLDAIQTQFSGSVGVPVGVMKSTAKEWAKEVVARFPSLADQIEPEQHTYMGQPVSAKQAEEMGYPVDRVPVEGMAAYLRASFAEDDFQGATPPADAPGSLYEAPTRSDSAVFDAGEGFSEFDEDFAAIRAVAERGSKPQGFVPKAVRS